MKHSIVPVERINDGHPLISPQGGGWESGCTANATAVYLNRSDQNDPLIRKLIEKDDLSSVPDGVVAVLYRASPSAPSEYAIPFNTIGMALFTPDLQQQLRRLDTPVLLPGEGRGSFDYFGPEDPRITRIGDTFFMVYCGPRLDAVRPYGTRVCLATSKDLLHWQKHGPVPGGPDRWDNKDGVLFPDIIDGKYFLLHRPWGGAFATSDFSIWLAASSSPFGPWEDFGPVMHSYLNPAFLDSWLGAGATPIPLGGKRYLVIYHIGNYLSARAREYDIGAAVFDFQRFLPEFLEAVVLARLEPLLVPETAYEKNVMPGSGQLDVVFPCGAYEYQGDIYILYGAGDRYTVAARVNRKALVEAVLRAGTQNPYAPST